MSIDIAWERSGDLLVALISGRLDGSTADLCDSALESGVDDDDHGLVIDFENLSYISSAGLRIVLRAARKFTGPDKKFAICSLSDSVREIVAISGFDKLIAVHGSREEAISELNKG